MLLQTTEAAAEADTIGQMGLSCMLNYPSRHATAVGLAPLAARGRSALWRGGRATLNPRWCRATGASAEAAECELECAAFDRRP